MAVETVRVRPRSNGQQQSPCDAMDPKRKSLSKHTLESQLDNLDSNIGCIGLPLLLFLGALFRLPSCSSKARPAKKTKPIPPTPREQTLGYHLDELGSDIGCYGLPLVKLLTKVFIGKMVWALHKFEHLPEAFQKRYNTYIKSGYRLGIRKRDCVRSVWKWHNESINIHTHLWGFVIFTHLIFSTWYWLAERAEMINTATHQISPLSFMGFQSHGDVTSFHEMDRQDRVSSHLYWNFAVFLLYLVSAMQCLGFSVVYHTFGCRDTCTFDHLLNLDYSGITMLIFGSQVPVLFYLYYFQPWKLWSIIGGLALVSFASYKITHTPKYQADEYMHVRVGAFCGNAFYATLFAVYEYWTMNEPTIHMWDALVYVGYMYLLYGAGVVIYATKFPECIWPGRFDFVAHSHQFWHIFVVCAAYSQYQACVAMYLHMLEMST